MNDCNKLMKKYEQHEVKLGNQNKKILKLIEQKESIELELKQFQTELTDVKAKLKNSSVFIEHSCKANSLLKEEKDALDDLFKEIEAKLKVTKNEYEKLNENYGKLEIGNNELKLEIEITNKKLNESKKMNELLFHEKEEHLKVFIKRYQSLAYNFEIYLISKKIEGIEQPKN